MFSVRLDVQTRCLRCRATRNIDEDGELIAKGKSTWMVRFVDPCSCGEHRAKVTIGIETEADQGPKAR
jgi:hypothetical protein